MDWQKDGWKDGVLWSRMDEWIDNRLLDGQTDEDSCTIITLNESPS